MSSSRRPKKRTNLTLPTAPKQRHARGVPLQVEATKATAVPTTADADTATAPNSCYGSMVASGSMTNSAVSTASVGSHPSDSDGHGTTKTVAAVSNQFQFETPQFHYDIDFDLKAIRDVLKTEEYLEESGYQSVIARSQHSHYGTGWLVADSISLSEGSVSGDDWDGYIQMAGEKVKIKELSEALALRYAFLSGAKTKDGFPVLTFPDSRVQVPFSQYHMLITYLLQVPLLEETHRGYVIIADRRLDKWSSVRSLLVHLSNHFPAPIRVVFLLKPEGVLQRALEMGYRSIADSCDFRIVLCQHVNEISHFIGPDCLTLDVGGHLRYNHLEWVQHRMELERLKASAQLIAASLGEFSRCLRDTELPNDAGTTAHILETQRAERDGIKEDFHISARKGLALLKNVRQHDRKPRHEQLSPTRLLNVTAIERMLIQLEETEKSFDCFWLRHEKRLVQCLELRRFEEEFRKLQANFARHMLYLEEHKEVGDSPDKATELILKHKDYISDSKDDLETAAALRRNGDELMAVEDSELSGSLQPKCEELSRMADALDSALNRRLQVLELSKEMHQQISDANHWCKAGVELLSTQPYDLLPPSPAHGRNEARRCLQDVDALLAEGARLQLTALTRQQPELHRLMLLTTTDTSTLLQQVSERINDVRRMCESRRSVLVKVVDKPVQAVSPEKQPSKRTTPVVEVLPIQELKSIPSTPTDVLLKDSTTTTPAKISASHRMSSKSVNSMVGYVIDELISTEKTYVSELESVIEHYLRPFDADEQHPLISDQLRRERTIIFGNLSQLCAFHRDAFVNDLDRVAGSADAIADCFLERRADFYRLYNEYCLNKTKSDTARSRMENCPYFLECQRNAGHRLPLGAYLLKPIQRITKYQLLLRELKKHRSCASSPVTENTVNGADLNSPNQIRDAPPNTVDEALTSMLQLLEQLNCSLYPANISGYAGEKLTALGPLLQQGRFNVWVSTRKTNGAGDGGTPQTALKLRRTGKTQQRHLFLYRPALVICKRRTSSQTTPDAEHYEFKAELPVSTLRLNEQSKGHPLRFDAWADGKSELYTFQPMDGRKEDWVNRLKALASSTTNGEPFSMSPTKRRASRPHSWASTVSTVSSDSSSVQQNASQKSSTLDLASLNGGATTPAPVGPTHSDTTDRFSSDSNNNPSSPVSNSPSGESSARYLPSDVENNQIAISTTSDPAVASELDQTSIGMNENRTDVAADA